MALPHPRARCITGFTVKHVMNDHTTLTDQIAEAPAGQFQIISTPVVRVQIQLPQHGLDDHRQQPGHWGFKSPALIQLRPAGRSDGPRL